MYTRRSANTSYNPQNQWLIDCGSTFQLFTTLVLVIFTYLEMLRTKRHKQTSLKPNKNLISTNTSAVTYSMHHRTKKIVCTVSINRTIATARHGELKDISMDWLKNGGHMKYPKVTIGKLNNLSHSVCFLCITCHFYFLKNYSWYLLAKYFHILIRLHRLTWH